MVKYRARRLQEALFAFVLLLAGSNPARAQQFDPRPTLNALIGAFQNCGPSQVYQMLSPFLFNLVAGQTNGTGCYGFMAAAGPVTGMQVIDMRQFPVGPVFAIRVTHVAGPVDWFIGFNQMTGRIEYLTYQSVAGGVLPNVTRGPDPDKIIGGVIPKVDPDEDSDASVEDEPDTDDSSRRPRSTDRRRGSGQVANDLAGPCAKFPQMCKKQG